MKKEFYPKELEDLIDLIKKRPTTSKEQKKQAQTGDDEKDKDQPKDEVDFITDVRGRDDLKIDYTQLINVKTKLDELRLERRKAKYSAQFHVEVFQKMHEQMPKDSNDATKLRIEVLLLLISTQFQASRSATFVSRDEWISTY